MNHCHRHRVGEVVEDEFSDHIVDGTHCIPSDTQTNDLHRFPIRGFGYHFDRCETSCVLRTQQAPDDVTTEDLSKLQNFAIYK